MHDDAPQDLRKRHFLTLATSLAGAGVVGIAAAPLVSSLLPSATAKAKQAPVIVDLTHLAPGQQMVVEWQDKPIWIIHRTEAMLAQLRQNNPLLLDPQSQASQQPENCRNVTRSCRPQIWVAIGLCTHLGCTPSYRPETGPTDLGPQWQGGYYCACHGARFDLAGRVIRGTPAPRNLDIPPHHYLSTTQLFIGEEA